MRAKLMLSCSMALLLNACGGGSSTGIGSTPTPAPSPTPTPAPAPTPINTTMTDLRANQSFVNDATSTTIRIDSVTKSGISDASQRDTLTVSYDAATQSYSLATSAATRTFRPADIISSDTFDTIYQTAGGGNLERLTLVKKPYSNQSVRQYVAMGFWQRNVTGSSSTDLNLEIFTYGLPTTALAVPKTGIAGYRLDIFGIASKPGVEPVTFQGEGSFNVDFAAGIFAVRSSTTEYTLITDQSVVGGGLEITAGGHLSSGDGAFSGDALYSGTLGYAGGTLSGRFFGPNGEEVGASFSANNGVSGVSAIGSFTGIRDSAIVPDNLSLTNMTRQQLFYTQWGWNSVGQLNWQNSETFTASPPTSDLYGGQFTIADKITGGDPNYTTYRKSFGPGSEAQDVTLKLFRPGAANTQLALSYTTFGEWATVKHSGVNNYPIDQFFFYGLATPARLLVGRTGSAHYQGIVAGNASNVNTGQNDPLTGTSIIDVNFGTQTLSASLTLLAKPMAGGTIDYGRFDLSGALAPYVSITTIDFSRADQSYGHWDSQFFGPSGEEIAAKFNVNVPAGSYGDAANLAGVAVAKQ